ncbi:uncharacterized protein LOC135930954 [Gordionus sp. m RMFG-2023]|uniref:uncharacterized protein LOC135930954 n=1 Tax=Gordionus sp. m RMFG-2023 TaxID=3053472 RepID=UPI0031FCF4F9
MIFLQLCKSTQDTSSKHTIIPYGLAKILGIRDVKKSELQLPAYDGNLIKIIGITQVKGTYEGISKYLQAVVVESRKNTLLGRTWINAFKNILNKFIANIDTNYKDEVKRLIIECESKLTNGPINKASVNLHLRRDAQPKIIPPRCIPYSKIDLVSNELKKWIHDKIFEPVPIDKSCRNILTIYTHYRFTRLPFGLTSSAIFQQIMDQIFGDMEDVIFYIDNLPAELSTFLGMAGYYRKFLNNFAEIADPLYRIVNNEKWAWNLEHFKSFNDLKKLISLPPALTYFNPELPIGIATDTSKCGLGAVLFHTEKDGKEKPIAFASRILLKSEMNYTNIEREALAIMLEIKRFQEYLIGTKFTIITDHKPLVHIFTKGLKDNSTMSLRLQKWNITLGGYDFNIKYKAGKYNVVPDCLSRLPQECHDEVVENITIINDYGDLPINLIKFVMKL